MRLFTERELKIAALVIGAATVVAVLITTSVGLARRPRIPDQIPAGAGRTAPDISELIVPEEFTLTGGERWYFSRDQLSRWNEEQIQEFWIDPASISIDLMTEESDRVVREFFDQLP